MKFDTLILTLCLLILGCTVAEAGLLRKVTHPFAGVRARIQARHQSTSCSGNKCLVTEALVPKETVIGYHEPVTPK